MDGRATGSNPFHPSRGPLPAILPLFPRRLQFPIPLGLNLLLLPGEHILRRYVADGAVESHGVNGLIVAASEQAAERERLAAIEQADEQERLAAAKLETFRINGLMEAASEQAVGTKMGTEARIN
jgi:hypothetical protein